MWRSAPRSTIVRSPTSAPGVAATIVGALVGGWWIATAGSVLLSLVAAFAIAQTLALARRRELGVLRALGVPHRRQARMRAGELSAVLAASVALGLLAGGWCHGCSCPTSCKR